VGLRRYTGENILIMQVKISPVFQIFEQQQREAKELFLALGKQIKSKKVIELSGKLAFLELYSDLMTKVHFDQEDRDQNPFSPFKKLQKNLRKIHHFKLAEKSLKIREVKTGLTFNTYRQFLEEHKKSLYIETFDLIVGSPLKIWDELLHGCQQSSKGIKPLMINTAINQIIQEELEFLHVNQKNEIDSRVLRDIFEGMRTIIMLENLLIHLGFNPIFVESIHQEISLLKENMKPWYSNHLALQSITQYLSDKDGIQKKYLEWVKDLKEEKKSLSSLVEKQAQTLFAKILI
jgi:hypothetical protein